MQKYLPSVVAHTPEIARVIVADNGSTDQSLKLLKDEFPQVEVMALDRNYGFAEGYNRAISQVQTPYVLLLNSDVRVEEDYVTPLYEFMEQHAECAACQPKILSEREPERFEYAGACGGFLDRDGYPYCRGRIFERVEQDRGQYDTSIQCDWASGAAMMVRTADYLKAGGLDASFFAHMEEIDLCWRLRLQGRQIWAVPQARVFHLGGGSLAMGNPRKTFLNFRNSLRMLHKNLPTASRGKELIRRRLLDTVACSKFLLTGKFSHARAIVKAHNDYRKWCKGYAGPEADSNLLQGRKSILVQAYIRGKKHYGDL